ncbi:MAG: hypothetical protein OWS03_01485 [Alicyclobacillaceae bacterium]|nr:hypothetical protein [Alicyclobacillaceae bacterium]
MGVAMVGILTLYTGLLLILGRISRRKTGSASQYLDGGRRFGFWHVFLLMTAMWGSSMFVVEIDSGYLNGLSAVWFGASTIAMSVFVAVFLLKPFRKIGYLTNSNLISRQYGERARDVSALVIGLTFPIFAMGNVLSAASFLHATLGWSLPVVLIATTVLVIVYVWAGGIWSLAYTQIANLVLLVVGLLVATFFVFRAGWNGHPVLPQHVAHVAHFSGIFGIGSATIVLWFVMSLLNSVSAQAEFQTIASVREARVGQKAVYWSALVLIPFAVIPTLFGTAARGYLPHMKGGLLAFPLYLREIAPDWAVVLVALGFFASALIWCAPLMFSGASSFGLDFLTSAKRPRPAQRIRTLTRFSLILQGLLMVIYALLRPEEIAWWHVFGLTFRNAVIVGPTITFLLWPVVRPRVVVASMVAGAGSGLLWNALTDFSATKFVFGLNPMWVGTGLSLMVLMAGTLLVERRNLSLSVMGKRRSLGWFALAVTLVFLGFVPILLHSTLSSLVGADAFMATLSAFFTTMAFVDVRSPMQLMSDVTVEAMVDPVVPSGTARKDEEQLA